MEQTHNYKKVNVNYIFKSANTDKKHLIVIFSAYGQRYSFQNIGKQFKSDVLWVRDDYEGSVCYYLGKEQRLDFSDAVNDLIESFLDKLCIEKKNCTLVGGSKGGWASLYLGLRYQYSNIISSAPTSRAGTQIKNIRPHLLPFILGENEDHIIEKYNNLLLNLMKEDINFKKNIYLFLSKDDVYYEEHQEYLAQELRRYENFNLVMASSDLAYRHDIITPYCLPLIISFVNSLIDGIIPKFGYTEIGRKRTLIKKTERAEGIGLLHSCSFDQESLFINGSAFFKGVSAPIRGIYNKKILFVSQSKNYTFPMRTTLDKSLSKKFFDGEFVDYTAGGFGNLKEKGIDLSVIETGVYRIKVLIGTDNIQEREVNLQNENIVDFKHIDGSFEYRIWGSQGDSLLSKRNLLEASNLKKEFFEIKELYVKESKLFIIGNYAVLGVELENWGDAQYYLILSNKQHTYSYRLGMENKNELNYAIGDGYGIYQKSCFATLRHKGIDVNEILNGTYEICIILSYKGSVFRKNTMSQLVVNTSDFRII